jgi:DNA invertase Pin-like site-specific DNA recombinase
MNAVVTKKRCAVYTRVSTDERLDQSFNSLDAQREAGQAYIVSQRAEGWLPVGDDYDDGGYSGGNMERPALKRLMADIMADRHRGGLQDRPTDAQPDGFRQAGGYF